MGSALPSTRGGAYMVRFTMCAFGCSLRTHPCRTGCMRHPPLSRAAGAAVADVYEVNRDAALEIAGGKATGYLDHRKLLERKYIDAVLIASPRE